MVSGERQQAPFQYSPRGRRRPTGSSPFSLRTRLLFAFIALAAIPCLTLTIFISHRLTRSIEFWGNPGVERTVDSSVGAARAALRELRDHLLAAVEGMAEGHPAPGGLDVLRFYEMENGRYALREAESSSVGLLVTPEEIEGALHGSRIIERQEGYLLAIAAIDSAALRVVVGGYAMPPELYTQIAEARRGASLFDRLGLYLAVSKGWVWISTGLVAILVLAAAVVLARFMAHGLTRPIDQLVAAMERLGRGEPVPTVDAPADREMAYLVGSFNRMASELERSRRELRRAERLAAWQEMARRVAHEIKNPLTPIQFALHRLKRELGGHEPAADPARAARLDESFDAILGEVESLKHMADEFSRLAKLPAPELRQVDLRPLLNEILDLYRGPGVDCEVDIPADLPPVQADPRLLRQVFVNLLKNAVEAMPDGGRIEVRGEAMNGGALPGGPLRSVPRLRGGPATSPDEEAVDSRAAAGRRAPGTATPNGDRRAVVIEIADSGKGVAPEIMEHLGEPYVTSKKGGSGLGIAVVSKILLDHHGRFELTNRAEGGALARIVLPADERTGAGQPAADPGRAARSVGPVVDPSGDVTTRTGTEQ
jgi:nitrogen fixation/metabolism regulation signal transduction histidine kinase